MNSTRKQTKRLGLASLKYYDESVKFLSGNALPMGGPEDIVEKAMKMYSEMSPETREFFTHMKDNELLDVLPGKNKAFMGYCTFIPEYKSPFVFASLNGSSSDINIITHEAGHAFQMYCSRNYEIPEYIMPTIEAAEIYSMTMEIFSWPWMNLFFGNDAKKYEFALLNDAFLINILLATLGDEFQQWVFENPDATPKERRIIWSELEKRYLPYRDYEGNEFLTNGGFWFRFIHFFKVPLYLIDYALAQVCALQFLIKFRENREEAWRDYLNLCKAGGSKSLLGLLKIGGLKSPFDEGCLESIVEPIKKIIGSINDSKF